jgi:excisionase family DNA binding protein
VDRRLLNVKEASAALGLSPWTLRSWISQRRITYVKLGRAVRFEPRDLDKLIERMKVQQIEEDVG